MGRMLSNGEDFPDTFVSVSPEPLPPCGEDNPERDAGGPIDDGWDPPVIVRDPNCPTCQLGSSRETTDMVCQTCGTDYAPAMQRGGNDDDRSRAAGQ